MKIVLTGNPSADYFNPLIAVAEEINEIIDTENLADTHLYFLSQKPYDKKALYENGIVFKKVASSQIHNSPVGFIGNFMALLQLFSIFPDVVFSTGGYASYPVLWAARLLKIPVIIHESNSVPNDVNSWAQKFAQAITVAYKQVADYLDPKKIIYLGQPILHNLKEPNPHGAYEFLNLEKDTPIVWVIGGTSGAHNINRVIEEALPELLHKYQIVHQTGKDDFEMEQF